MATAINTLATKTEHDDGKTARVAASIAILERVFGRPPQVINVETNAIEQPDVIIISGVDSVAI